MNRRSLPILLKQFVAGHVAGANLATDTGANASAEGGEEELDDADVKVNNIVNSFRLQSTSFDKKAYLVHLKGTFLALRPCVYTDSAP